MDISSGSWAKRFDRIVQTRKSGFQEGHLVIRQSRWIRRFKQDLLGMFAHRAT
jgi:hypothetical protein